MGLRSLAELVEEVTLQVVEKAKIEFGQFNARRVSAPTNPPIRRPADSPTHRPTNTKHTTTIPPFHHSPFTSRGEATQG